MYVLPMLVFEPKFMQTEQQIYNLTSDRFVQRHLIATLSFMFLAKKSSGNCQKKLIESEIMKTWNNAFFV